ncbi:MAG: DUF3341 domain-containing protein [Martelella sp.]
MPTDRLDTQYYAAVAGFAGPEGLASHLATLRQRGYRKLDVLGPYFSEEIADALDAGDNRVAWITLAGGLFGALAGLGVQLYANYAYPLNIGGRPVFAWHPLPIIPLEVAVMSAIVFAVIGTLLSCRLPKLHHPDFEIPDFSASDRFYILVHATDEHFDTARTPDDLKNLGPETVALVPLPEAPS